MITFTRAGAVASPTTLQIRVTRSFPDRVAAGAPAPERSLGASELVANIEHFTSGQRGPRTRPCTALVLSGVDLGHADGVVAAVRRGRELGIERVTLHVGRGDQARLAASPLYALVDAVALTVREPGDAAHLAKLEGRFRTAVLLLDGRDLSSLVAATVAADPERVVLTWPFPPGKPPASAVQAAQTLSDVAPLLGDRPWGVKGLPACRLGPHRDRLWRSGNRWYVDADHQNEHALLFFPSVVRFDKADDCRFCAYDDRCDGAPADWIRAGIVGPLEPIDDLPSTE